MQTTYIKYRNRHDAVVFAKIESVEDFYIVPIRKHSHGKPPILEVNKSKCCEDIFKDLERWGLMSTSNELVEFSIEDLIELHEYFANEIKLGESPTRGAYFKKVGEIYCLNRLFKSNMD